MEFEVGETFGISASVNEDHICSESGDVFIKEHDLEATLVGGSYVDAVATIPSNLDLVDNIYPNALDTFYVFSSNSLPSASPECRNMSLVNHHDVLKGNVVNCVKLLGTFRRYDPCQDPYIPYLGNMPVKIMLTFAFDHSKDFSKAFDKFRRALTIIRLFMFVHCYLHSFKLHAQVFDKLIRGLTAPEMVAWIL